MKKTHLPAFLLFLTVTLLLSAFHSKPKLLLRELSADTTAPWWLHAKDHKGKTIASKNGVVSFTTGLHNDFYFVDSLNKTGYLYVETRLSSFLNDNAKRVPLNISIVIDRSGSMQGVKMGNAKKAAKAIIDQLKSEDFVSVVMYDNIVDSVQIPIKAIDKETIKKKIDGITPRSATNLWGGTEKGYEFVQRNYRPGFINRVLLISDGLANAGLTDSAVIRLKVQQFKDDHGITLSTFGVGLDYNEVLMTDMAETGQGNYYFVDDPAQMASLFEKEVNGLMSVAAQDAELRITMPAGADIISAYPLKFRQSGNEISVKFRDLFSEETKGVLFRFRIKDGINTVLKFNAALQYTDVTDGLTKTMKHENELSPIRNVDAYLTHFNKNVIEQVVIATANENLEKAMVQVDHGDYDGAQKTLLFNSSYLKANYKIASGDKNFAKLDSVNSRYTLAVSDARSQNVDSVKKMQKTNKAENYRIRNKKQ